MAKTADTIAIYSRKSRYTGKGESIGNQIDLCREYIRTHYGDAAAEHAVVFEDEGFSGGNLNRPDFKKMMTAAKERKFKAIVVYRLDRISRNISDFSSLIEELGRLGIDFVSIRESFDTSSPMGRAMMYIASVFSQLERETIAERIRDNMHELAKTGRSFTRFFISFHAITHLRQNGFFGAERVVPFFYFRGCHVRVVV